MVVVLPAFADVQRNCKSIPAVLFRRFKSTCRDVNIDCSGGKLAYHALAAGLLEPAFHLSLAAGENAMQLFAERDEIASYEQARQLLTEWHRQKKALPALPVMMLQQRVFVTFYETTS